MISSRLPSDAIVEFFTALCAVSCEELRQFPPRVFSLQKLVEISYYNMTRIRMVGQLHLGAWRREMTRPSAAPLFLLCSQVWALLLVHSILKLSVRDDKSHLLFGWCSQIWARIWALLSVHFIAAGQHPDQQVAMYAMDSIRQLALKYLERAELTNFSFQNDILKPFVVVMRTSKNELIREFILQCVVQVRFWPRHPLPSQCLWRAVQVCTPLGDWADGEQTVKLEVTWIKFL